MKLFKNSARVRAICLVAAAVTAASVAGAGAATADPIGDLINPPSDPAAYLPTPLGDPFFDSPPGYESTPLGTVLNTRPVSIPRLKTPVASTQYLFHSTDSKDRPIVAATTLLVPTAPWSGADRPVVSFNLATDSLGNTCAPSYTLPRGTNDDVDDIQKLLDKNYAVLITDYQGPRQAYSAGRVEAHTVLDSLRAVTKAPGTGVTTKSPIAITGYSGGAIASGWAAELAPTYAPELNIVGVAPGGTPTDYTLLRQSLNGQIGSGLYLAATFGLAREYPEMNRFTNDNGKRLALAYKDLCSSELTATGFLLINQNLLQNDPNAFDNPIVQRVIADNRLGSQAPTAPIFLYHGKQDFFIPLEGAQNLYNDWCAKGAQVQFQKVPGEHTLGSINGQPLAFDWISQRLAGVPAEPGCSVSDQQLFGS